MRSTGSAEVQIDTAILIDRIEGAGASLALVTEDFEKSATGTFLRNAKSFVAELEREKITERTGRGKRARVASGKPLVGQKAAVRLPVGTLTSRAYLLDPETAPIVRRIFDLALGGTSLRSICAVLERDAIPSPGGDARWTATGVRHILIRPTYSGTAVAYRHRHERRPGGGYVIREASDGEMVAMPGIAPAIVTSAEQTAVLSRLDGNQANATRNNRLPEASLLRCGVARCGYCDRALAVKNPTPNRAAGPPRYYCKSRDCAKPSIATTMIDGPVWEQVAAVLRDPAIIAREVARHRTGGGLES